MSAGEVFPRSVVVYGTGLMGCSLALALKKNFAGIHVYGVDEPEILARARRLGAVEPDEAIPFTTDLVILATPVASILQLLDKIPHGADLILDVGSTKVDICRKAEGLKLPFLGGHPMTGLERSGPDASSAKLFAGEPFFLCSITTTPADAISKLSPALRGIGARPIVMSAEEHDSLVAQLSHLPQILSTLLADQTQANKNLAGPGWKSLTRLAASPFHVWRDILQTSGSLPEELRSFISRLHVVLDALESGNIQELEGFFGRANDAVSGGTHES